MVLSDEQWKSREVARLLALVETERRYWQEIVSNLPVPLAILNSSLTVVSANRAFRTAFDVRQEDLNSKRITDILPAPELAANIAPVFTDNAIPEPLLFETGAGKRVRVTVQVHRNWDEDTVHALLTLEELPEVPPAAPALSDKVPAAIWTVQLPSREYAFVSDSAEEVTGLAKPDWTLLNRIEKADRAGVEAVYEKAIAEGGVYACEFRLTGRKRWYRETVRVADGLMHGVLTDITERRAMEEHLLQSQRVDALAGFSGRAAHDLNNPLMIVSGYGEEILASLPEGDARRNDMAQVMDAAKRIGEMAAGLQAFSRKPVASEIPPSFVIGSVLSRFATLDSNVDAACAVAGDPEVFATLLSRVIEAMDSPVVLRSRETHVRDLASGAQPVQPGSYVVVRIESSAVEPLKRPLFESPNLRSELARAFRQVETWGGSCWSSPDGRIVRILLPQVEKQQAPVEPEPAPPAPAPKRILVVDDEMGIRTLMRKILAREGYVVFEAGSGAAALPILEKEPLDLLLTDVVMPGITGRDLAERATAMQSGIRVLYVSGFTDETLVETGQYPPGSQLLQKPFTLASLQRKVKEVLA